MAKVYGKAPEDAVYCGLQGDFKKNTEIVAPKGHFGVVKQGQNISTSKDFTGNIKLNKKEVPYLKVPFLFGKIKDVRVYFYPYQYIARFTASDRTFTAVNGKKAKISMKISYEVKAQSNHTYATIFNDTYNCNYPDKNGTLISSYRFNYLIEDHILGKGKYACKYAYDKAIRVCDCRVTPYKGEIRKPYNIIGLEADGEMAIKEFFNHIGYNVVNASVQITDLHFEE